jgi:hypothetical protein
MKPNQLHAELTQASASLKRCDCGSVAVMAYEPGCTFIRCLAEKETKMASPDFNPVALAAMWNERKPT